MEVSSAFLNHGFGHFVLIKIEKKPILRNAIFTLFEYRKYRKSRDEPKFSSSKTPNPFKAVLRLTPLRSSASISAISAFKAPPLLRLVTLPPWGRAGCDAGCDAEGRDAEIRDTSEVRTPRTLGRDQVSGSSVGLPSAMADAEAVCGCMLYELMRENMNEYIFYSFTGAADRKERKSDILQMLGFRTYIDMS